MVSIATSRSAFAYGNERSSSELTTLNITLLAPMPMPSVRMTMVANPGLRRMSRKAY
jgi:hypothetical protein